MTPTTEDSRYIQTPDLLSRRFSGAKLDALWPLLSDDVREQIVRKANWERIPCAAVIHHWWPELWAEIAC
jgi:hypothetical protein